MEDTGGTQEILERLRNTEAQNASFRQEIDTLYGEVGRLRGRGRIRTAVSTALAIGTILLFPTAREAVAQAGLTLRQRVDILESRMDGVETLNAVQQNEILMQRDRIMKTEIHVAIHSGQINALLNRTKFMSVKGKDTIFSGTNVHIRNGLGATNGNPAHPTSVADTTVNGLGNLIVGYNEASDSYYGGERGGSHNLVVGLWHNYSSFGGLVAGFANSLLGPAASISGGGLNTAGWSQNNTSQPYASISGGKGNQANARYASIAGGAGNLANGESASVSGGNANMADGTYSAIGGGIGVWLQAGGWAAGGNWYPTFGPGVFHAP